MRHLIIGGGGPRAIVTGVGSILALRSLGLNRFSTIGGISGGSIPALFAANGNNLSTLIKQLVTVDFTDLLKRSQRNFDPLHAFAAVPEGTEAPRHKLLLRVLRKGAFHTDRLGEMVDEHVREWPDQFWTMAMSETSHVLFTKVGVWEYGFDGSVSVLSEEPAPLSLAIRATCAIPGILEAIEYRGRYLFDGSLSPYGACPVEFVRKHFLGEGNTVIRCFASGKEPKHNGLLWRIGRRLLCHNAGATATDADANTPAEINIEPSVPEIQPFSFKLTDGQKRLGILAGFNAAIDELFRHPDFFQEGLGEKTNIKSFDQLEALAGLIS
jgi:predicted acylesterase/phospholipase RssA